MFITTLASREASPIRAPQKNGHYSDIVNYTLTNGNHHSEESLLTNGHTTEHSDDEYIDTVDVEVSKRYFYNK